MPSVLASKVIDDAEALLLDTGNVRWTATDLLVWLNAGLKETAVRRQDACVQTKVLQLAAGSRQTLGSGDSVDAVRLLSVNCNMGTDGETPGDAIQLVPRFLLDSGTPGWRAATATDAVESYTHDPGIPLQWFAYPPNTGDGRVELTYAAIPADVEAGDAITVSDIYANALVDYVLYRAFTRDSQDASHASRAVAHYQAFLNGLALEAK